jgi:23S rRNA (uracil1939-C5)-methyltransferase
VLNAATHEQLQQLRLQLPNPAWRQHQSAKRAAQRSRSRRKPAAVAWQTIHIDDVSPEPRLNQRLPFRQGNSPQNARMREWLALQCQHISATTPAENPTILELFCGAGNFTEILAVTGRPVLAVEASAECVDALNAKGLPTVTTHCADLFDTDSVEAVGRLATNASVLVLDPPRAGLSVREPLLRALKSLQTVLYISCDVATWARDCADFLAAGFELEEVQPLDLFPQTPHVELLTRLVRR